MLGRGLAKAACRGQVALGCGVALPACLPPVFQVLEGEASASNGS